MAHCGTARWRDPRFLKARSSSNGRLTKSRPCRPRRICMAKRSSFTSLSPTLWRSPATLWMAKSTTIGRSRFTIPPNTVRLRRGLAGMSGSLSCRLAPRVCTTLVITRFRAMTPSAQSRMRAKPARPPLCCMRCKQQVFSTSCGEITPLQMRWWTSLSLWQTKEGHRFGKHLEPHCGCLFVLTGRASDAVRAITSGITLLRSTGATLYEPRHLWFLAMAYAELGQLDDARRCIDGAIDKVERSKEKWCEAEGASHCRGNRTQIARA